MKRLLQSGFAVGLLLVLVVLAVINTAQLHNLESRLASLETGGIAVKGASTASSAGPAQSSETITYPEGTCYASDEDEQALKDPANLLKPFAYPPGWPKTALTGQPLRRLVGQDPPGMNTIASNNAADLSEIYRYIGTKVAMQSQHHPDDWYPDAAIKVVKSADGLTYDVWLRSGMYWHPPAVDLNDPRFAWLAGKHEVVADDFAFTLELLQNEQVGGRAAAMRPYVDTWKNIEVVDPHHFRLHVTEDRYITLPSLLDLEATPRWLYGFDQDGRPFDPATLGEKQNTHWYNQKGIGAGPYRFVEWKPGEYLTFEANPDYALKKCLPPVFSRIEMKVLKDQQSWLRRLKAGELDYTMMQPQQYLSEVKDKVPYLGEDHLKLAQHDEAAYFYFGWNLARPMFADKRVRKALTESLDREGLVKSVFAGLGEVTSGPFDMSNPCYDHSIAPLPYDLADAARLLDEAGWKDTDGDGTRDKVIDGKKTPFSFTLLIYGSSTEYETLARVWAEALDRIGIKMTPQSLEWAAQLKRESERDFDGYAGAWVPSWEIDLMQIWHSKEADKPDSSNYVSFRNPEADRIAEALGRTFDPAQREQLCHQFHKLIADEQPYTFFYQRKRPVLYWDYMNDPVFSKLNPHRDARLFSFASAPAPAN